MERRGQPDHILFFITMVLITIGLIMVLSASSYDALLSTGDAFFYFKRQILLGLLPGFLAMVFMMNVKPEFVKRMAVPGLLICIVMLVLVLFIGVEAGGAKRWLGTQSVRFAPAEVARPVMIVFFALWLTTLGKKSLQTIRGFLYTGVLMVVIPLLIAVEDLGTAVSLLGALGCMLIAAEVPWRYISVCAVGGLGAVAGLIVIEPYRMQRLVSFADPFAAPLDGGYQVVQSLYAIGSGWLFGVGLGNSRQKLLYLPARHTDFIFAIIGEELGFVGATAVILLFCAFIWRGFKLSMNIEDKFKALTTFGLTAAIGIQALINIGVAVGAMPVTGITLPFISYGGTSLAFTMASVGFILNMSRYAKK